MKSQCAGTMVHKIDACMLDLLDFHTRQADRKISMSRKRSGRVVRVNSHRQVPRVLSRLWGLPAGSGLGSTAAERAWTSIQSVLGPPA